MTMRRRFRNKRLKFWRIVYITAVVVIFLAVLWTKRNSQKAAPLDISHFPKSVIGRFFPSPTPTQTPTPTPTPTSTPTPTITPTPTFTGFCVTAPVLMYHHVEDMAQASKDGHAGLTVAPNWFDAQMKYLVDRGYKSIFAEELINDMVGHINPGKVAVVTLDDGYEDNYFNAFPVAKKYGIKLNIMLATGLLENSDFLKWSEIKEMADSGWVRFGNHTWSHYSLPNGSDEKINSEIGNAQTQISDHVGYKPTYIAWPWGSYDNRTIAGARANGVSAGFSTIPGQIQCDSFLWGLHRTRIGNANLSAYGI